MIVKQYGMFVIICDCCCEETEGFDAFQDALDCKDRYGWESKKSDGEWENICPDCQEG